MCPPHSFPRSILLPYAAVNCKILHQMWYVLVAFPTQICPVKSEVKYLPFSLRHHVDQNVRSQSDSDICRLCCAYESYEFVSRSSGMESNFYTCQFRDCICWKIRALLLVHGQVTIIFVVSVCLFVCLSVCLCRVFLSRL